MEYDCKFKKMATRKYEYLVIPRKDEDADAICTRYLQDGRARIIVLNPNKAPWGNRNEQNPLIYYITMPIGIIKENGWDDDLIKYQTGKQKYHCDPGERLIPGRGWLFEIKDRASDDNRN